MILDTIARRLGYTRPSSDSEKELKMILTIVHQLSRMKLLDSSGRIMEKKHTAEDILWANLFKYTQSRDIDSLSIAKQILDVIENR